MDVWALALVVTVAVLFDTGMKILATLNLAKIWDKRPKNTNYIWLVVIWVINSFGWISYFMFGRIPSEKADDEEDWG